MGTYTGHSEFGLCNLFGRMSKMDMPLASTTCVNSSMDPTNYRRRPRNLDLKSMVQLMDTFRNFLSHTKS